jgi:hypothetical protein
MADERKSDQPVDLEATEARQGTRDRRVFWMLAFSTALAAILLVAIWIYHAPRLASVGPGTVRSPAVAQTFHGPAMPPTNAGQPPAPPPAGG